MLRAEAKGGSAGVASFVAMKKKKKKKIDVKEDMVRLGPKTVESEPQYRTYQVEPQPLRQTKTLHQAEHRTELTCEVKNKIEGYGSARAKDCEFRTAKPSREVWNLSH